jgi:pyruvate dehydrogenase (quinone)
MGINVSDHVIERLHQGGVRRIYGYPGDGINGLMGALNRARDSVQFVQARHEELAAFMACAHAKFTGEVGVCMATSGPGAIHLLNGLYDAKLDHQPVLAIVGQQARSALGSEFQQEVDLASLFKDVASEFVQTALVPQQIRHLVDRAVRIARDQRGVTCLIIPSDVQELPAVRVPPRKHFAQHSGIGLTAAAAVPDETALEQAAEVLNAGQRVAILAGAGALHATDELIEIADLLGAGIAKALLGKACVPDDLPFVTGSIGLLGTAPSWHLMEHCDTLLMVGSNFPYTEFLPEEGHARGVQIDVDPRRLSSRYPMEVNLVGDSRATLRALRPHLRRKDDRRWREEVERDVAQWWQTLESRAMAPAEPINPQQAFWVISPQLPADAMLTCDSGTSAFWYARDLKIRSGMKASLSGGLATMGSAVPYAIAAKHAFPERAAIAFVGDGAMQMIGINALVSLARDWTAWPDPRFVIVVLNNGDLNMVSWEQRTTAGDPKFEASQDLPRFPYAQYAQLLGLHGQRVERPDGIADAWHAALQAGRPALLELVTDPNVPPLPPHVTREQIGAYLRALIKRDPDAPGLIAQSAKQWWAGLFPSRSRSR